MAIQLSDETRVINKKQLASIIASLTYRSSKDNLALSTRTMMNEQTKTIELWVMLTNR